MRMIDCVNYSLTGELNIPPEWHLRTKLFYLFIPSMSSDKLLIIGSDSELIKPLISLTAKCDVDLLPLSRKDWDLTNAFPPLALSEKILEFEPTHLLYSAGLNIPQNLHQQELAATLKSLNDHFAVNCSSFISIVLYLQDILPKNLVSIHVISSLYGIFGRRTRLPYSVSKHALEGAVKCLATEYPETLTLAYRPGFFKTKLTEKNLSTDQMQKILSHIPSSRLGTPLDLSKVILRNILEPPMYASGTSFTMDGGLTAGGIFEV